MVGVNKYRSANISNLEGCVNDVQLINTLLIGQYNFTINNIVILTDRDATKQNILNKLDWLVKDSNEGDELLFHFSGHGSYVVDYNNDEVDGYDEILCTNDLDWNDPLTDDILKKYFKRVHPGAKLVFLCDSCHSGTIMDLTPSVDKLVEKQGKENARFLTPPEEMVNAYKVKDLTRRRIGVKRNLTNTNEQRHILFAGCAENDYSSDAYFENIGKWQGAFSYYLVQSLKNNPHRPLVEIEKLVCDSVASNGFEQVPQMITSKENETKPIFRK